MASAKKPRISGAALRTLATAAKAAPTRALLSAIGRKDLGVQALIDLPPSVRSPLPFDPRPLRARSSHERTSEGLPPLASKTWPRSTASIAAAYRKGTVTPVMIVERALKLARELGRRTPSMDPMLEYDDARAMRAAEEATRRIVQGAPRSPLDGVPITIKEEVDVEGLTTRLGTSWITSKPAEADAYCIRRLREAGAVILGTTSMTEYGMSPIGVNPQRELPRNPHHTGRVAGGSSTGAAVSVATGLVPVAIGCDGGGSIRIPASLCGVFGLKATFGRVTRGYELSGSTVTHVGPIGASTYDLALIVEHTAGEDAGDPATVGQPALSAGALTDALGRGVRGLRIGVPAGEWSDAHPEIARAGRDALAELERAGAVLVDIDLGIGRHAAAIGYQSIGPEAYASFLDARREHFEELGADLQVLFHTLSANPPDAYMDAQRLRATLRRDIAAVLREVDLIAMPTTASTAVPITTEEMRSGIVDATALHAYCRFSFLANLTGLPAGTAPIGRDRDALPFGVQFMGDAWDEACVLQVLAQLERSEVARVERPTVAVDLLG